MRPKRTGNVNSRLWAVLAAAIVAAPALVSAAEGPGGTEVSANEFLIVVKPGADRDLVKQSLLDAGFGEPQAIPGLSARYTNYALVNVPSTDAVTKQRLTELTGLSAVRPVYRSNKLHYPVLPNGQVIVRFLPGTTYAQAQQIAVAANATIARQIAGLQQAYVLNVDEGIRDTHTCAGALAADPNVRWAHPSVLFKLQKHQAIPIEDTLYPWQWHLNNTGQLPDALPGADIEVEEAWNATLGAGALVAVIDECLQHEHADLTANYVTGYDFLDQDPDPSPTYGPSDWILDPIGEAHGTAVGGLIAAAANTIGVRGVAPEAGLIGCKIGLGIAYTSDQDVADAFLFAERSGAMVINNSWGGPGGALLPVVPNTWILLPNVISDTIEEVATTGRGGKGVLITFSSGNDAIGISYGNVYAAIPEVMAIGATLRDDTLTCYSNFGPEQSVVAPGGGFDGPRDLGGGFPSNFRTTCYEPDIVTTDNTQVDGLQLIGQWMGIVYPGWPIRGYNPMMKFLDVASSIFCPPGDPYDYLACQPLVPDNFALAELEDVNYTRRFNGTSAACPVASGVAALVFSVNPGFTAEQVRGIIEHTADKPAHINESFDSVTGHSNRYGHGRVNAREAVQAALAGKVWPKPPIDLQNASTQALARFVWTNPPIDVDSVLVVRGAMGRLDWAPQDGVTYTVGQQVAPGVLVVANTFADRFEQADLPADRYEFAFFVRSAANYYSWGVRGSFASEGPISVPEASLSALPTSGRAPLTVHFAGGAIDPTGTRNLSFSWNFGDGSTAFGATVDHTYVTVGNYLVRLRVTNTFGQTAEAVTRINVFSEFNIPPQATISASQSSGPSPLVVRFVANASDADGAIVSYFWDFGDGATAGGSQVEHTFINTGVYGVTMTATDNLGAVATDAVLITVQASSSATAARTEPEGILSGPACGSGVPLAAVGAVLGLLGLIGLRRR